MIPEKDWKWMGHKAHLCVQSRCQFGMATQVGNVVVSTVGEYREDAEDADWTTVGLDRKYETMTFKVAGSHSCGCADIGEEAEWMVGYNDAKAAQEGHLEICRKAAESQ